MKLSLIIPCYNEEGNVIPMYETVRECFKDCGFSYELVFVNDGSSDRTPEVLDNLLTFAEAPVKAVHFSRNFGKESAILAGLREASGEYSTILDGDLQQSPTVVLDMVNYLDNHPDCDCVTAFQENRKEPPFMVFMKKEFYRIINLFADTEFVNGASDFRTFRQNVKEAVLGLTEYQRFSKGIFSWVGFHTHYIPYTVEERLSGTSKWNFIKLMRYALSGIISFTTAPLRFPLYAGAAALAAALGTGVSAKGSQTKKVVSAILLSGSLQLLSIGILGVYTARIAEETKHRPVYIIKKIINKDGR